MDGTLGDGCLFGYIYKSYRKTIDTPRVAHVVWPNEFGSGECTAQSDTSKSLSNRKTGEKRNLVNVQFSRLST